MTCGRVGERAYHSSYTSDWAPRQFSAATGRTCEAKREQKKLSDNILCAEAMQSSRETRARVVRESMLDRISKLIVLGVGTVMCDGIWRTDKG